MTASDPPKPPPELDAIVDRVLTYRPKDTKPAAKSKRPASGTENPPALFSRRKQPPK